MKKLVLILNLMLVCFVAFGQRQFSLQTTYTSSATGFVSANELYLKGEWQVNSGDNFIGIQQLEIKRNSIELSPITSFKGEKGRLIHLIPKVNGGYVGIVYDPGCRYAAAGNFLINLDNAFNPVTKRKRIEYFFRNIRNPIEFAHFINDETLVLANKDLVTTYNIVLNKATAFNDSLSQYDFILPLKNSFVCLSKDRFYVFNSQCNVTGRQIIDFAPKQLIRLKSKNGYIAIGHKNLAILNTKGIAIYEHNWKFLEAEYDSIYSGFFHQDTLNIIGFRNKKWVISQITDQFGFISTTSIGNYYFNKNGKLLALVDVAVKNNHIYCIKNHWYEQQQIDKLEIYLRKNPTRNLASNTSLNLTLLDSLKSYNDGNLLHVNFYGSFSLNNLSNDTIYSFFLNWKSNENEECSGPQQSIKYTCKIAPNERDSFTYTFKDSFLFPESAYQICIGVSSPNGLVDTFLNDNQTCTNTILPPVSIDDNWTKSVKLPSLLKSGETLTLPLRSKNFNLIDLSGKSHQVLIWNNQLTFPKTLKQGLYVLQYSSNNEWYRHKILIVN